MSDALERLTRPSRHLCPACQAREAMGEETWEAQMLRIAGENTRLTLELQRVREDSAALEVIESFGPNPFEVIDDLKARVEQLEEIVERQNTKLNRRKPA